MHFDECAAFMLIYSIIISFLAKKITPTEKWTLLLNQFFDLVLNAEHRIQRNGLFAVLKAEVFGGNFDRVGRLEGFDINFQTFGFGVVRRFDLDGN